MRPYSRLLLPRVCSAIVAAIWLSLPAGAFGDPAGMDTPPPRLHARLDPFGGLSLHAEMKRLAAQHKVPAAMTTDLMENAAIARIGTPSRWLAFIPISEGGSGGAFSIMIAGVEGRHLKPLATINAPQGHARPFVRHDGRFEVLTPVEDTPMPTHVQARLFAWDNGAPRPIRETTLPASTRPLIMYCAFTQVATNQPPRVAAVSLGGDPNVFLLTPSEPPFADPLRIVQATYHFDQRLHQPVLDAEDSIVIR
ncbi:MAG: hypothetical protein NVSMB31_02750 [Vulcanimicrobiaceae bacterium]